MAVGGSLAWRLVREAIVEIDPGRAREAWVELLELADEPAALRRDLDDGTLFGVVDDASGRPRAAVLTVDRSTVSAELRAVAVAEDVQGTGLGSWLVAEVCERLQARGIRRVVVGTATSGIRQLGFYQRLGFRLSRIERDFFSAERGYPAGLSENGIPTRDMAWMDREL